MSVDGDISQGDSRSIELEVLEVSRPRLYELIRPKQVHGDVDSRAVLCQCHRAKWRRATSAGAVVAGKEEGDRLGLRRGYHQTNCDDPEHRQRSEERRVGKERRSRGQ